MDVRSDKAGCYTKLTHYRDNKRGASGQEKFRNTTRAVGPCEENERGAQSEKNARREHNREKKQRAATRKV